MTTQIFPPEHEIRFDPTKHDFNPIYHAPRVCRWCGKGPKEHKAWDGS